MTAERLRQRFTVGPWGLICDFSKDTSTACTQACKKNKGSYKEDGDVCGYSEQCYPKQIQRRRG